MFPAPALHLKKGKIRGVESNGMLLLRARAGARPTTMTGIIELPDDAPVGTPAAAILGLDDPVIEVAVTPNRGDCLGVHGIARDLAAAGLGTLKPFDGRAGPRQLREPGRIGVAIFADGAADACPMVVGRALPRREERPQPEMAAGPAEGDRAAADLGAGRHHQLRHLRPRPAAARLRRGQARRRPDDALAPRDGEEIQALDGRTYDARRRR